MLMPSISTKYQLFYSLLTLLTFCNACSEKPKKVREINQTKTVSVEERSRAGVFSEEVKIDSSNYANGFDFPVGKPDGRGYYNAQVFGENNHLGDDWNGVNGGNSDLGDPIYAIGRGYIKFAQDIGGGWGNVIRIVHYLPDGRQYESVYAHCNSLTAIAESWVEKGSQIGTIGTANGQYYAHLHLEVRDDITMKIGSGYAEDQTGYIDPTDFIKRHRTIKNY